jgi:hypothetical protein
MWCWRAGRSGGRWRTERWESLRFRFPNWSLELPGYAYSGDDPNGLAHWREILRVIEACCPLSPTKRRHAGERRIVRAKGRHRSDADHDRS